MKQKAKYVECWGSHEWWVDSCSICAPFWKDIPCCPIHTDGKVYRKLAESGYCSKCKKYYEVEK